MIMKITIYILIALIVFTLGAAITFYLTTYQPMFADYMRMKASMPDLDRAKAELKKLKEKESKETAWINPAIDVLSSGLSDEIKSGKTEVLAAANSIIVNIAEDALFMPGSYTFTKESPQLRQKLISLLTKSEFKGKEIYIGNTTEGVPAQGSGRKRVPEKDARTLATERSSVLIKDFEKNGMDQNSLVAAAYASKQPDIGFTLRAGKTVLIIENPPMASMILKKQEPVQQVQTKPTATMKEPAETSVTQEGLPKTIPIQPTRQKTN